MAVLQHEFTATGTSQPVELNGEYTVNIHNPSGSTIAWERSVDAGTTWTQSPNSLFIGSYSGVGIEPSFGILYRANCTVFNGNVKVHAADRRGKQ